MKFRLGTKNQTINKILTAAFTCFMIWNSTSAFYGRLLTKNTIEFIYAAIIGLIGGLIVVYSFYCFASLIYRLKNQEKSLS